MAIAEHLDILLQGKETWNAWRDANPEVIPDLSGADLSHIDLSSQYSVEETDRDPGGALNVQPLSTPKIRSGSREHETVAALAQLHGVNLRDVTLDRAILVGGKLVGADLSGASLNGANLHQANLGLTKAVGTDFTDATLDEANLATATLRETKFTRASLKKANLQGADLTDANLWGADFQDAILLSARMSRAYLQRADLRDSTLWSTDLEGADLSWADLRGAELRSANLEAANVYAARYNRWALYRGIQISSAYGSPKFRRFAQDQDFIEEFRSSRLRYPLYLVWLVFADCGRSFTLWAAWSVLTALGFGLKYYSLGVEAFDLEHLRWGFESVLYYSVVTFTTLGFGDIVPRTPEAAHWVMAEVIVGYLMLGGLISILATKLARRS